MLAIEVELLAGRYAATQHNDRSRAEWPPHPARFFSALVAALYDRSPIDPAERRALEWLEGQDPPQIDVSLETPGNGRRQVLGIYVPVNDISLIGDIGGPLRLATAKLEFLRSSPDTTPKALRMAELAIEKEDRKLQAFAVRQQVPDVEPRKSDLEKAVALRPDRRTRQVRTMPVFVPDRPWFAFLWQVDPPADLRLSLAYLCDRVTRLGHSSSMVRCHITDRDLSPTLVPDPDGGEVLRTIGPGQLARLETAFVRHRGIEHRVLPAQPQRYGPPARLRKAAESHTVFAEEWIIFERVGGVRPLSSRGVDLTNALRRALIEQHGLETMPPSLSGHLPDRSPTDQPHVAFVALPDVGHRHGDASIQGCAIVLPRGLTATDRETLFRLVARWERDRSAKGVLELAGGTLPPVLVKRVDLSDKISLRPRRWCRPSRRFATVTPVALDRNPGNLRSNQDGTARRAALEAQQSIVDACVRIGLPQPAQIAVSMLPAVAGAQPARDFRPWPVRRDLSTRVRVHADIAFHEPVRGPVILGAGRFFGLGLCLPLDFDN